MALAPGVRLGPYEIVAQIGRGGMGEVYQATDTNLKRQVAIKVLPESVAADSERLARFQREAEVLASLNHPNIAAIYGLEKSDRTTALVMELVEGPTLADRIAQGAIPIDEALPIAKQIAEALEAAHEQGIIHRDLKPANVKVRPDGTVKVLDFGLAKALEPTAAMSPGLSQAPTITTPAMTQAGVILGTAAYMSPEQARGKPVDKRADIWAFGCVVYEMLTGRRVFASSDVSDTLAFVLTKDVDWTVVPTGTPRSLKRLLERCLERDPKQRLRDIGDGRIEIEQVLAGSAAPHEAPSRRLGISRAWAAGLILVALVLGTLAGLRVSTLDVGAGSESSEVDRSTFAGLVTLPDSVAVGYGFGGFDSPLVTLSPDGRWLVFVGRRDGASHLYRREMDSFEDPEPIDGTEGAIYAFFSPDGETVGFLTQDRLRQVSIMGKDARTLAQTRIAVRAIWAEDGYIYVAEDEGWNLRRVSAASGGALEDVLVGKGLAVTEILPGGRFALASAMDARSTSGDFGAVVLVDLTAKTAEVLFELGYDPRYSRTGHILYGRGGTVFARPFDPIQGVVTGDEVSLVSGVSMDSLFVQVQMAVSDDGTIAYVPGSDRAVSTVVAIDRLGREIPLNMPAGRYGVIDLSPSDSSVALQVADVNDYIAIWNFEDEELRRVSGSEGFGSPQWSVDGDKLAFTPVNYFAITHAESSNRAEPGVRIEPISPGQASTLVRLSDAFTAANAVGSTPFYAVGAWSPAGTVLATYIWPPEAQPRIAYLPLDNPDAGEELALEGVWGPVFSPDGNWIAFSWTEAGRYDVWISSYPDGDVLEPVSLDGGLEPVWCVCGEIFFRQGAEWYAATVTTTPELGVETPRRVFSASNFVDTPGRSYDVSSDGERLFIVASVESNVDDRIHILRDWVDAEMNPAP